MSWTLGRRLVHSLPHVLPPGPAQISFDIACGNAVIKIGHFVQDQYKEYSIHGHLAFLVLSFISCLVQFNTEQ